MVVAVKIAKRRILHTQGPTERHAKSERGAQVFEVHVYGSPGMVTAEVKFVGAGPPLMLYKRVNQHDHWTARREAEAWLGERITAMIGTSIRLEV